MREIRRDPRGAGKFRPGFHRLLGEMARMQGCSGPTHALREKASSRAGNEVVRVLRPANYRDYCPVPSRCHRPSSYFMQGCLDRQRGSAEVDYRHKTGRGRPILDVAGRGYPRKHEAEARGETQGR
jgi:hypothetical protein